MQIPLEVVFDDFAHSTTVDAYVRREMGLIEPLCSKVTAAQVVVARPQRRYRNCGTYEVSIHFTTSTVSKRLSPIVAVDDDIFAAIDDAFEIVRRRGQSSGGSRTVWLNELRPIHQHASPS